MVVLKHVKERRFQHYALVLVSVGVALGLRLALGPVLGQSIPLLMFTMATMVCAWYGGFWPGMLATLCSALCAGYFFLSPLYSLRIAHTNDLVAVAIFLIIGGGISSLAEVLHQARRRVEHMVQVRDHFLSLASHELKTPLTALLAQAELMQRRADRDQPLHERHRHSLVVIATQARRLARLVDTLLDVSRLQQGSLPLERTVVDVVDVVQRVVAELQLTAARQTIRLTAPPEPICVEVDELRFEQVLFHLLHNALKYSPDGSMVQVQVAPHGDEVHIVVHDAGVGIPGDALPQIFDRFFRVEHESLNQAGGLGLGLSLVQDMVRAHGGHVQVASGVGRGSTFTICLPRLARACTIRMSD